MSTVMNPIRWGILGGAAIARSRFIPAMKGATAASLVGIASRSADKARVLAQEFHIPRHFGSYEALIDDPGHRRAVRPIAQPSARRVVGTGPRGRKARAVRKAALPLRHGCPRPDRGARQKRPAHRGSVFLPQPPAVGRRSPKCLRPAPSAPRAPCNARWRSSSSIRTTFATIRRRVAARSTMSAPTRSAPAAPPSGVRRAGDRRDRPDPAWKIDRLSTALLDYGDSHASFTVGTQSGTSAASWATHQQFSVLASNGWLRCDFP